MYPRSMSVQVEVFYSKPFLKEYAHATKIPKYSYKIVFYWEEAQTATGIPETQ